MRRPWIALLLLAAACPEPKPKAVTPSFPSANPELAPPAKLAARAHPMQNGEALGGPNATGKPGDWILDNGEVVFVVEGLGGGSGFAESGGNVIDAADAKVRKDELGQLFTYFGTFPRQAVYTSLEGGAMPGGAARVTAKGRELYDPALAVETDYVLQPGARALSIATTITNTSSAPAKLGLGDAIQWGGADKFAPGKPVGFTGRSSGPFLGGIGRFTSYAITSTDGHMDAINGSVWSDTEQVKDVTIEPGKSVRYERVFLVGERPDAASVVAELTKASGQPTGRVELSLTSDDGHEAPVTPGSKVIVATPDGKPVMSFVAPVLAKTFGGELPVGTWSLSYAPSAGRRSDAPPVTVVVPAGGVARASFRVGRPGALDARCDRPCKITVEGIAGTDTPSFGSQHAAPFARNQILAATPTDPAPIAPGRYRLTFSRGPEWEIATREITVEPGQTVREEASLRRAFDTAGYVATDFHQHSMLSADAPVSVADRVRSNVVEGVEVAVASEHNFVADFTPVVKELGLAPFVVAIPGDEITTDADKNAWGHANVFPLVPDPAQPRAGAFAFQGRTPKDVFDEARKRPGRPLVQVNHPRSGLNGYFDRTGFDPKTGVGTIPGYVS